MTTHLDAETGLAPVASLGVVSSQKLSVLPSLASFHAQFLVPMLWEQAGQNLVPDGVTSPQADPLGNGPVLLLGLGKLLLGAESLLGL